MGLTVENGRRLLLSMLFLLAVLALRWGCRTLVLALATGESNARRQVRFWVGQALNLLAAILILVGLLSIWFDDPTRLSTAFGPFTAGLAFALQRVITAFAGYVVILRGNTFTVGDRLAMGGVRGDVLALGGTQSPSRIAVRSDHTERDSRSSTSQRPTQITSSHRITNDP